jgi:hypothetical protein
MCHMDLARIGQGSLGKMSATCQAVQAPHVMPHVMPYVSLHGSRGFTDELDMGLMEDGFPWGNIVGS